MIATKTTRLQQRHPVFALSLVLVLAGHLKLALTQSPCPVGYIEHEDGSCQSQQQLRCPPGMVFAAEECRKIMCSLGELYNGICLQAACPPGLVWRGKRCQEPGYLTTILEIENILTNEVQEKPMYYEKITNNNFVVHNFTLAPSMTTTESPLTTTKSSVGNQSVNSTRADTGCCTVRTPRICKHYDRKWICFNRSRRRCDPRVCTASIIYLRAPEVKYTPSLLIMPPGPLVQSCNDDKCLKNDSTLPDCSGCASNHPENCSFYCYQYLCPSGKCNFIDLKLYCSYYPGQFGCVKEDGCLWNWC